MNGIVRPLYERKATTPLVAAWPLPRADGTSGSAKNTHDYNGAISFYAASFFLADVTSGSELTPT
jgi:hypothetical protein